jgi:DNA topoisomerase-3
LPNLNKGDQVNIDFKPLEKVTTPPKRYSVETLNNFLKNPFKDNLKEIDDNYHDSEKDEIDELKAVFDGVELGTEATRSTIINNAVVSKYISLKDNVYHLEPMGKFYVESLEKLHVMLPKEKTVELGMSLKKVYKGEIKIDDAVDLTKKEITSLIVKDNQTIEVGRPPRIFEVEDKAQLCKCPRCGNIIAISDIGYRCCNSGCGLALYKDNKLFASINKKIDKKTAKTIFTKGEITYDDLVSKKTNKTYQATLKASFKDKYVNFTFVFPNNNQEDNPK